MGTDMHLYAEKRVGSSWRPTPEPRVERRPKRLVPIEAMDVGRPYGLFSLLSGRSVGMRCELVEPTSIFTPRGFPPDMSPVYKRLLPSWYDEGSDWGLSWVGLGELVELDWDQPLRHHAYVQDRYRGLFRSDQPFPESFPKEAKLYHGLLGPPPEGTSKAVWSISLRDHVGCADWFIGQLKALAGDDELRIIYWFNS